MPKKAAPEPVAAQEEKGEHELQVARYLASAFIAQSHGIGMDYALKKYAHMPVGDFWLDIARQVIEHTARSGSKPSLSTIQ
jgi:hypothetical protein